MIKNYSSSQKTLKSQMMAFTSDVWCLDRVSLYSNYFNQVIIPDGYILDDYFDYFETVLVDMEVPEKYYYSPTGFAEYLYGDPALDFIVLYFSKIPTLFNFDKPVIKVLPPTLLKELNKLLMVKKKEVDASRENPKAYQEFADIQSVSQGFDDYYTL